MLSKKIENIDKFYAWLGVVLVLASVLIVYVARGIFSSISLASQIDTKVFEAPAPRLIRGELDRALSIFEVKDTQGLDL